MKELTQFVIVDIKFNNYYKPNRIEFDVVQVVLIFI